MIATWTSTATRTAVVDSLTPRAVSQIAPAVRTREIGPHQGCHEVYRERVSATSPPDMVNTAAMATVYPTATSRAVAAPALGPRAVST